MHAAHFALPVRIVVRPGEPVTEVYTADEGLALLMDWPVQEGPVFQKAMEACLSATTDHSRAEHARKAFVGFARASGILAKDVPLDSLYEGERLKGLQGE